MKAAQRIIPPVYFFATLIAMALLHLTVPVARIIPAPLHWVGAVPLVIGVYVAVSAARSFERAGTPVRPFEQSRALVTDGMFRMSRNPMYLGMVTALIGVAILLGSVTPFLPVPLFFLILQHWFVRHEEDRLERTFGDVYREYRRRVRRWI